MRQVQFVLLSAILVVLSVIAYDLHRLAADFQIGADLRQAIFASAPDKPETLEERQIRLDAARARAARQIEDTAYIYWGAPLPKTKPSASTRK
jgi:hypothetical protein